MKILMRFVIHACINGYSQLPMFWVCSDNNRASTVLQHFYEAMSQYGLPSQVRMDICGENTAIARYMLLCPLRGPGRGITIVGASVHNQRVECLWRALCLSGLS